jgi:hypothetical protein
VRNAVGPEARYQGAAEKSQRPVDRDQLIVQNAARKKMPVMLEEIPLVVL